MRKGDMTPELIHIAVGIAILILFAGLIMVIGGNAQEWVAESVMP